MSNNSKRCTCGGCGTGTACATTSDYTSLLGVYAYAAPDVEPFSPPTVLDTNINLDDSWMRSMLKDEIIQDLIRRVQKLEQQVNELKEQDLELTAATDALADIMSDQEAPLTRKQQKQLEEMQKETNELLRKLNKRAGMLAELTGKNSLDSTR